MELRRRFRVRVVVLVTAALALLTTSFGVLIAPAASAAVQSIPYKINFQGRLTDNNGNALTDGFYNIKFRIYSAASGGTNQWEGDRVFGTTDNRVQVTGGLFNIQFGDTSLGDPALSPALFSGAFPLYLEVELPTPATANCASNSCASFTEGAMTPRQPLASAAYAFNSDTLDGIDSTGFVQLTPSAQQSGSVNVSGTIATAGALQSASLSTTSAAITGASALTLGSTANAGAVLFNDGTASNRAVTLNTSGLTGSYTLTLPTTGPAVSQCLLSGATTASQLTFGACASGITLQSAYNSSTNPEITLGAATTAGLSLRDNATAITGNLFEVQNNTGSTTYFGVTNAGASIAGGLNVSTAVSTPSVTSTANLGVIAGGTGTLALATSATAVASTNSGAVTLSSGNATGTGTSTSGTLIIGSGNGTAASGNVSIDSGTGTTRGTIAIGATNGGTVTVGRATVPASLPGGLTTSNAGVNAGTGTVSGGQFSGTNAALTNSTNALLLGTTNTAQLNVTGTGAQTFSLAAGGTVCTTTTSSCASAYQVAGSYQAAGNYLLQAPTSTAANTIVPTTTAIVGLTVKGVNTSTADILDIYNSTATPTLQSFFASNGGFNTSQAIIAPTSTNTINGAIINAGALSGITGIASNGSYTQTGTAVNILTGQTTVNSSSYLSNQFVLNDGLASAVPTIPGGYAPAQVIRVSQTTGSRPLFFGYDDTTGTGWAATLNAGACGSFTQMCFNLGSGTTTQTALENAGTTLNVGGGDDGNFTNIAFKATGTSTFTGSVAAASFSGTGTALTALNPSNLTTGSAAVTLQSAASNSLTITANAASIWSTSGANQLTLQSGSGTISLGSTTILTAGGALAITAGSTAQNISINPTTTGSVVIGGTTPNITSAGGISVSAGGTAQNVTLTPSTTGKVVISGTVPTVTTAGATALIIDAGGAAGLNIGSANANAITLGHSGITTTTNGSINVAATAVPTTDQVAISNVGQPTATSGVNGLNITYVGGAITAGGESSGERIDVTPGTTNSSTWNGLRIVSTTNAGTGVNFNGIKIDGPGAGGAGTETGLNITTGWDVGLNIQSGGIQMTSISDPATPASGTLATYARDISGRTMLKSEGSSGVSYALQPSLFQQNIWLGQPGSANNVAQWQSQGAPGTYTTIPTLTTGGSQTLGYMAAFATAATAGTSNGFMQSTSSYYRGSVNNGNSGFFTMSRVSFPGTTANYTSTTLGSRYWAGMTSQTTVASMGASDAPTGDFAGFRLSGSAGETTFHFLTRNNTTTTNQNTGVTLVVGDSYDMYMYVKNYDAANTNQNNTIYWRIDDLTAGTAPVEGNQTLTLPTTTTAMRYMTTLDTINAAVKTLNIQRMYVETDR